MIELRPDGVLFVRPWLVVFKALGSSCSSGLPGELLIVSGHGGCIRLVDDGVSSTPSEAKVMTWGRPAIEKLFGGLKTCDVCLKPAIAFHLGRSRCEDHLTAEMTAQRLPVKLQGNPGLPGKPEILQL